MAYLPKGIGDRLRLGDLVFETLGPEWPTCRKALVTSCSCQLIPRRRNSAGMAYLPKGIGDSVTLSSFSPLCVGLNGLLAERHWWVERAMKL